MPRRFHHAYPSAEEKIHVIRGGGDCFCEPIIEHSGETPEGYPVRFFVHQQLGRYHSGHNEWIVRYAESFVRDRNKKRRGKKRRRK